MSWDLFISYASEDKPFVTELARALKDEDLKVWFDESELHVGDNLRQKIEQGLNRSRFALVVLSPQFFGKEWPRRELDGLMAREAGGEDVIFPILHNVSVADVARH